MKSFRHILLFFAILWCVQLVKANTGGNGEKKTVECSVHGYVKDAVTRKPVTGVTVSFSSGNAQNAKEILSDAFGYFHFAKMPPGDVTLMFEKKGYKISKRDVSYGKECPSAKIAVNVEPIKQDGGNESWHPLLKLLD